MSYRCFLATLAATVTLSVALAQAPVPAPAPAPAPPAPAAVTPTDDLPPVNRTVEIKPEQIKTKEKQNPQGVVTTKYTYYIDAQGRELKHGGYQEWYDSGERRREVEYLHGAPHGRQRWWHANGQVWMEFSTDMGVRHGTYQEFWPNGQRRKLVVYDHGRISRKQ